MTHAADAPRPPGEHPEAAPDLDPEAPEQCATGDRGADAGGTPRHFCVPAYATSTPHPSTSTGMPASDVTQSTSSRASPFPAPSGAMSLRTPVDVSAWTTAITAGEGWASSRR